MVPTVGGTMERTNFENLRVYQLSEKLADEIWQIVLTWEYFSKDTIGKQIVRSRIVSERI